MDQQSSKKVVLITGASRGIGAETAILLGKRGFRVVVNYASSRERADKVVEEICSYGGETMAIQADVRNPEEVHRMVEKVLSVWGSIDSMVNNASMSFVQKSFLEMTWEEFSQKLNDEMISAFTVTKSVLPSMIKKQYGRIVHVASGLAKTPAPGMIAHGSAKASLVQFAKYVAQEVGEHGITVNVISPGLVDTEASSDQPQAFRDTIASLTPMKRIASAEDIAKAIAMYADDDCQFITGAYIPVNGGIDMN